MIKPQVTFAPPTDWRRGNRLSRSVIVAALCADMGVSIECITCGTEFVPSKPLSDESEQVSAFELSKALYHHDCDGPEAGKVVNITHGS